MRDTVYVDHHLKLPQTSKGQRELRRQVLPPPPQKILLNIHTSVISYLFLRYLLNEMIIINIINLVE